MLFFLKPVLIDDTLLGFCFLNKREMFCFGCCLKIKRQNNTNFEFAVSNFHDLLVMEEVFAVYIIINL